jgi:hypothetical protein
MTALPLPGPLKAECPCGCGKFGAVRQKVQRDGLAHVRGCPCRRCAAPRHKNNASARERRVARDTGGERSVLSGALSGYDGRAGLHVWEETAEVAIVRGFRSWIEGKGVTGKLARLMGTSGYVRHFIVSWDGKPRWVVTPYDDWASTIREEVQ